jgi:hypothetical protein
MPNPFPGMDPYIEARGRWPDFHHEFISQCRAAINARLPSDYVATINERLQTIELAEPTHRVALPDVSVIHDPAVTSSTTGKAGAGTAVLEPYTLPQAVEWLDEPTEGFIEIYHLPEYRLVTGVEVLSPSNKFLPGRVAYLAKRRDSLHHGVNLVEIDLLLEGDRLSMLVPLPAGDFYAFVTRAESSDRCDVYPWSVRQALPTIHVPLRPADPDVLLDLAEVLARTYEVGRYDRLLRHGQPVELPLSPSDAVWVRERASTGGRA